MKKDEFQDEKTNGKETEEKGNAKEEHDENHRAGHKHYRHHKQSHHAGDEDTIGIAVLILLGLAVFIVFFNQLQINSINSEIKSVTASSSHGLDKDLSSINLAALKTTGHTVAAVFALENAKTQDEVVAIMFPTGTPEYGAALSVSFDDALGSLDRLSKMYPSLKSEVQKNNPAAWQRFMRMASMPVGMSCQFCCGIGLVGIDVNGNSACGCQHNPAILAVSLYLTAYTDYSDGEILREAMRWKTLFFPKDMIQLGMTVSGGDTSTLNNLPGMVGGC